MTCHALHCPHPALPGAQQCREHWLMLPASVRAKRPWVDWSAQCERMPNVTQLGCRLERGQMELFS